MPETIISKRCNHCNPPQVKPLSEFDKHPKMRDGHVNICKVCRCEQQAQYRKKYQQSENNKIAQKKYWQSEKGKIVHKRYRQSKKGKLAQSKSQKQFYRRSPEERKAKDAVYYAIKSSKLPHPNTLQCHYGNHPAQQYHHHKGYAPEHLLDVIAVCKDCHIKIHNKSKLISAPQRQW